MKKEYDIKKEIKRLSSIRGAGTELISLYIPPGTPISDVTGQLKDESGQASNIKSKSTKLNVQGAIDKIIQYLKVYREVPKNGIVVFAGNISKEAAKPNIQLFSMEPLSPVKSKIYRCDSEFLLEPIQAMVEIKDVYALVVMDGRDATIGTLKGTHFNVEKKIHSLAHAKVHKGGQSQARFQRMVIESIEDYYSRVGEAVNDMFAKYDFKLKGLLVGGPGPTKENFVKAKALNYQIKVLGVFDTGYTDEVQGVRELIAKSREVLEEQAAVQERNVMERFLSEVAHGNLAVSGYQNVRRVLEEGNITRLIISEGLELTEVHYRCPSDNAEITAIEVGNSRQSKHSCGAALEITKEKDAIEYLIELADRLGIDVFFITEESEYGKELMLGFGGVAALLKYRK